MSSREKQFKEIPSSEGVLGSIIFIAGIVVVAVSMAVAVAVIVVIIVIMAILYKHFILLVKIIPRITIMLHYYC